MLQMLFAALCSHGAVDCGAVSLDHITLSEAQTAEVQRRMPDAKTVVCALYSYNAPDEPDANICRYARGKDYHSVIRTRLTEASSACGDLHTFPLVDASPLPEVYCAALCGLGVIGQNGLLLHPVYGSRLFIGTLLTNLPCDTEPHPAGSCIGCGKCIAACPTGALHIENGKVSFSINRCVSELTQKKGELTPWETEAVRAGRYVWGCDQCSDACPINHKAPLSELVEFRENLLTQLKISDLEGLSNRTFGEIYKDRAFTWRGPGPLRRNLALKEEK